MKDIWNTIERAFSREIGGIRPNDPASGYQVHRDHDPVPNREGFVEFTPLSDEEFRTAVFGKRLAMGYSFSASKQYADEQLAKRAVRS